jgi:hypothetical protein
MLHDVSRIDGLFYRPFVADGLAEVSLLSHEPCRAHGVSLTGDFVVQLMRRCPMRNRIDHQHKQDDNEGPFFRNNE